MIGMLLQELCVCVFMHVSLSWDVWAARLAWWIIAIEVDDPSLSNLKTGWTSHSVTVCLGPDEFLSNSQYICGLPDTTQYAAAPQET